VIEHPARVAREALWEIEHILKGLRTMDDRSLEVNARLLDALANVYRECK